MDADHAGLILVVDDEPDLVVTCERLLRRNGYEVVSARSVHDALHALRARSPRLVVADFGLPDGTGLDVVRAARALAPPAAAIVMTGQPSMRGRQAAFEAGAAGYLAKPFSLQSLADLVAQVMRG